MTSQPHHDAGDPQPAGPQPRPVAGQRRSGPGSTGRSRRCRPRPCRGRAAAAVAAASRRYSAICSRMEAGRDWVMPDMRRVVPDNAPRRQWRSAGAALARGRSYAYKEQNDLGACPMGIVSLVVIVARPADPGAVGPHRLGMAARGDPAAGALPYGRGSGHLSCVPGHRRRRPGDRPAHPDHHDHRRTGADPRHRGRRRRCDRVLAGGRRRSRRHPHRRLPPGDRARRPDQPARDDRFHRPVEAAVRPQDRR